MALSKEVKVGLLALVAGIILYVGFNYLKGIDFFSPTKKYYVVYDNVSGLTVSNPVTLNGMNVGRVDETRILINKNNRILVTLEVDDEIKVGDGTEAMLKNSSFLGGKEISLVMKPSSRVYKNGDTLVGTMEKNITDVIGEKAMPVIEQLDSMAIKLNALFDPGLQKSVHNTMSNFEAASGELKETISRSKGNISNITSNLSDLTASLTETEKKFRPILTKMDKLADSLNDLQLKRVVNNANAAMKNLQDITAKINSNNGTVGLLLNDRSLYDNLNNTSHSLDTLIKYFQYNPRYFLRPLGSKPKKNKH